MIGASQQLTVLRIDRRDGLLYVECVLKQLDFCLPAVAVDRDNVETARTPREPLAGEKIEGNAGHAATLEASDGLAAGAEVVPIPRLHFDEHNGLAVARDNIDLATAPAVATGKNSVPSSLELATREIFSGFPQLLSGA